MILGEVPFGSSWVPSLVPMQVTGIREFRWFRDNALERQRASSLREELAHVLLIL
jgi:hypothetical protein